MKQILGLMFFSVLALGVVGCSGSDPAPTKGDAEITQGMPENQAPPASAAARSQAAPAPPSGLPLDR